MPRRDPNPVLLIEGVIRGDREEYDSRPDSNGVVRPLGRVSVLTNSGGFCEVRIPTEHLDSTPTHGPVEVRWEVGVYAWRNVKQDGSTYAELAMDFVKDLNAPALAAVEDEAAKGRARRTG